jgi:hypothetical protein
MGSIEAYKVDLYKEFAQQSAMALLLCYDCHLSIAVFTIWEPRIFSLALGAGHTSSLAFQWKPSAYLKFIM